MNTCVYVNMYIKYVYVYMQKGFPGGSAGKESTCKAGAARDTGSIPGWGRSLGGGNGNPLQYSCLENSMERGVSRAPDCDITKNQP